MACGLTSLLAALDRARARPVLIEASGEAVTGGDLLRRSANIACALERRGPKGSRALVPAWPTAETVAALVGAMRAGWIAVPLGLRYRAREILHVVRDCRPAATVGPPHPAWPEVVAAEPAAPAPLEPAEDRTKAPVDPQDPATPCLVVYTSGTTGRSKGAVHTQRSVFGAMGVLARAWGFGPDDVLAHTLPLHHVHGLCIGIFATLASGVTVRLAERFDPAAVVAAFEAGATLYCGVPTQYVRLLEHLEAHPDAARVLARARLFTSGSAALPVRVFEAFENRTGHRILERYGMTETMITLSNPLDGPRVPGTVGYPLPGFEIRVEPSTDPEMAGAGELLVRGLGLFAEYYGAPEATADAFTGDGFFRTGDLVRRDPDGRVRIVGRISADIIKTGGFKVAAPEIEAVLLDDPRVAEAAVFGVPDDAYGEAIAAAVVLRPDAFGLEGIGDALVARCAEQLAGYKKPRHLLVLDGLPRNAMGKVQKHVLRDLVARGAPAEGTSDDTQASRAGR
ncbi:MAG: acyl-CoA synthetase [Deltaproteobacteria bacterium]|nr:MAG: acyl-CoA synthetase [Deltaproteobacteria bacterium]